MSMILDALSRAEQERRSEEGVILDPSRYVGDSSIKEERLKKWLLIALAVNVFLAVLVLSGFVWKSSAKPGVVSSAEPLESAQAIEKSANNQPIVEQPGLNLAIDASVELVAKGDRETTAQVPSVDKKSLSLQDEAIVSKPVLKSAKPKTTFKNIAKKNPPVRYATNPLPNPQSKPVIPEPVTQPSNSVDYMAADLLSPAQRSQLSQYVINVHVYDSNAQDRFVLINMTKYKEGDRLSGGGPLVSAITPEGVVMDTGSGKVLLERK